jgi:hypothetical protein
MREHELADGIEALGDERAVVQKAAGTNGSRSTEREAAWFA